MRLPKLRPGMAVVVLLICPAAGAVAADWPMWRCDAARTAVSPEPLAGRLHLRWVRQYPQREPCWQDPINRRRMPFDRAFSPIVAGKTLLVPFNDTDKLVALDTDSGEEKWRFYADAPVRLPAVAGRGRVYFVSDDGSLYGLDAADGKRMWRVRGGPSDRWVLGNRRLISSWPARGGPVLADGKVYWAASIWPFMGTFIRCTDAASGKTVWINDGDGPRYTVQPHHSPSFSSVAPQGSLACLDDLLIVPGGRSVPAVFDRRTGRFLYYHLDPNGHRGGSNVAAAGNCFVNGGILFNAADGKSLSSADAGGVLTGGAFYRRGNPVEALSPRVEEATVIVRKTISQRRTTIAYFFRQRNGAREVVRKITIDELYDETTTTSEPGKEPVIVREKWTTELDSYIDALEADEEPSEKPKVLYKDPVTRTFTRRHLKQLWSLEAEGREAMIRCGDRLYCGEAGSISAIQLRPDRGEPALAWVQDVDGTVVDLLAADGKLFAVTLEGRIYCFGPEPVERPRYFPLPAESGRASRPAGEAIARAKQILAAAKAKEGYGLFLGAGDGSLLEAMAAESALHIIAVDPDAAKVERLRRRFDAAGLYGRRIHLIAGDPFAFASPPYLANLVVVTDATPPTPSAGFVKALFRPLRPYGGTAVMPLDEKQHAELATRVGAAGLENAALRRDGGMSLLSRVGPLPDAGVWTHQNADAGNSLVSRDARVRSPLGLLWFGGSSHEDILPRHGHGPTEQVIGGRLFIEGPDSLRALDVYTGRILWQAELPGVGELFDNTSHEPGANATGGNYVSTADTIYLAYRDGCLLLDPATGKKRGEFKLAAPPGKPAPSWSYINVLGDWLIAGSEAVEFDEEKLPGRLRYKMRHLDYTRSHSMRLTVLDRRTGRTLWTKRANFGFRHNAVAAGAGKLFCLDRLSRVAMLALMRAGKLPDAYPSLTAYELKTGRVLWKETRRVFGTWLGYSADHDILLQGARPSRDMLDDEYHHDNRMATFRAASGEVIWDRANLAYNGPPLLHGEWIYAQESAYNLLTGRRKMARDPVTGGRRSWKIRRNYGCNTMIASKHLMTFRSAAAGFYDLTTDSGTGNFGGFKSGCTSNLIVADGVLCAPDYTRTCTCSYPNQTSLALIHWPEGEIWTDLLIESDPIAANLGAPGGRRAEDRTAWAPFPKPRVKLRGLKKPEYEPPVRIMAEFGRHFDTWTRHPSVFTVPAGQASASWIVSSGIRDCREVVIHLATARRRSYAVQLHFAEPEDVPVGRRVFDVTVAGKTVLKDFDVVAAAGGPRRAVVRTFRDIEAAGSLAILLIPKAGENADPTQVPVLSGIRIELEKP